jgi:hypothetical protein
MKHFYILIFCVFGFVLQSKASTIFDIATNRKYELISYSKEYTSKKSYFNKKIEIDYQNINKGNDTKINKINSQTLEICTKYIENEALYLSIIREANSRKETFLFNENNRRNYRENNLPNPELQSISLDFKSIINGQIFYEVSLLFKSDNPSNDYYLELDMKEYYLANINTGLITKWNPTINQTNKKKIEELVYKNFQETYLTITNKLTARELLEYNFIPKIDGMEKETPNFTSVFDKIDITKADFIWYDSGLLILFQEFSNGRELYGGKFFNLFFPYDEAIEIVKNIPEFKFVSNLPKPSTLVKKWSSFDILYNKTKEISSEPQIVDFINKEISSRKIKSVTQTNYQINNSTNKRFQGKIITEFNAYKKPLSILYYGENEKLSSSTFNDYDSNNNLVFVTKKSDYDKPSYTIFDYDNNLNLKKTTVFEKEDCFTTSYFYNKNYLYTTNSNFFKQTYSGTFRQYEINSDFYQIDEIQYVLNENEQLKAIISDKNFQSQVQIGRDEQGRIVETHKENDRYNYYFEYDNFGRLIQYLVYEFTEEKERITFSYNPSEQLPFKKTKTTNYGGNQIFLEENYQWTYFE